MIMLNILFSIICFPLFTRSTIIQLFRRNVFLLPAESKIGSSVIWLQTRDITHFFSTEEIFKFAYLFPVFVLVGTLLRYLLESLPSSVLVAYLGLAATPVYNWKAKGTWKFSSFLHLMQVLLLVRFHGTV